MKKLLLITPLLLAMQFNIAAAAEKLTVDGEITVELKRELDSVSDFNKTGYKMTRIVNFNYKFDKHWAAYTRIAAQQANLKYDFYTEKDNGSTDSKIAIDNFGVIYENAGVSYNIGQQTLTLDQQGLIFDNSFYLGREMGALKAVNISGTTGKTTFTAVYGQMYATPALADERLSIAGLSATVQVGKNTKIGATYAHSNHQNIASINNYALHAEQQIGKLKLQAEVMRATADEHNNAYAFSVAYEPTDKDYFAVIANKTEANAAIAGYTAFENDQKGFVYQYNRKFNDSLKLKLEYVDNRYITEQGKYRVFTTALVYGF